MGVTTIGEAADRFQRQMLRRERSAAAQMVRAYAQTWVALRTDVLALTDEIAAARTAGLAVEPEWLFQQRRYRLLLAEVEGEITRFGAQAGRLIVQEQLAAVELGERHARDLTRIALQERAPLRSPVPGRVMASWVGLPREATAQMVGTLQPGSPLRDLLDGLGPDASASVRRGLVTGLARGLPTARIANEVRDALGGNLTRALTITRTEVLRSYRESSRLAYEANSDIVQGWIWHASLSDRTCAHCWAKHGSRHRTQERMATHPRCRCSLVPDTRSWADLGFPKVKETRPRVQDGEAAFARKSAAFQEAVLGPAKFRAYKDGQITLADLAGERDGGRWGQVGYERSLAEALRQAGAG